MDTVFLDIAKAFDKVDHNILLEKVKKQGSTATEIPHNEIV